MSKVPFLIGKPKIYPSNLVKKLVDLFSTIHSVKSAYLAQLFVPNSGIPPHPIVGINIQGDLNTISKELEEIVKGNVSSENIIEFFPASTIGLSEYFCKIAPFYQRNDESNMLISKVSP